MRNIYSVVAAALVMCSIGSCGGPARHIHPRDLGFQCLNLPEACHDVPSWVDGWAERLLMFPEKRYIDKVVEASIRACHPLILLEEVDSDPAAYMGTLLTQLPDGTVAVYVNSRGMLTDELTSSSEWRTMKTRLPPETIPAWCCLLGGESVRFVDFCPGENVADSDMWFISAYDGRGVTRRAIVRSYTMPWGMRDGSIEIVRQSYCAEDADVIGVMNQAVAVWCLAERGEGGFQKVK